MITIRINLLMTLVTLVVISFGFDSQYGVLAVEQKNSTDPKPESPLWQISSTQSSIVPISPSIATSTLNSRSTTLSSLSPPTSSVSSPTATKPNSNTQHNTARDEIYIDDEGLEGSGGRGEIHDDLEKEPEYSGSGFGPDDEDSTSSTTHQRKKGNAGYKSTNTGSGGYKPTNSKNKSQVPDTKANRQPETHEDDLESGSGDKDIDRDDEDQDVDEGENEDLDAHIPQPEEGEDNETGRSVGIPNVKTNLNTNGGEDEDDLTTTIEEKIEKTDGISIDKQNPDSDSGVSGGEGNEIDLDQTNGNLATGKPSSGIETNHTPPGNEVFIMDNRGEDRTASFFAQPGILAAVIGGAVVGLLCAILVVMFIVYRMRKKDEGSYALDEPKRSPAVNSYAKNANNREFYA